MWKLRVGAEAAGVWVGGGMESLGLTGEVDPADLRAVLAGLAPGTGLTPNGTTLRSHPRRVPGFDLTFAVPKSVSVAYADVAEAHPWLPEALFSAYVAVKRGAMRRLRTLGWAMISLPWLAQEEAATRDLMGENSWPYGVEANRLTLAALLQYSHEQD